VRIISWNLHGANVAGRASGEQQRRAWDIMRGLGADLILAQESRQEAMPNWEPDGWTMISGEFGRFRKNWKWGSVIAARPGIALRPFEATQDWSLAHLYDLVLVSEMDFGQGPMVVASVHTAAMTVKAWIKEMRLRDWPAIPFPLSDDELETLRRPDCRELPYINDFAFEALDRIVTREPFFLAGDWNTCRKYKGGPQFFARARKRGWYECHAEPEEPSYLGDGVGAFQLDHAFCDTQMAQSLRSCRVYLDDVVRSLSDHAALIIDFED
jgi:endonuclease/exonuclease/phosphatase family metal-dependent hydrolase